VEHVGSTSVPGLRAKPGDFVVRALRRAGIEPPVRDALPE